jgi:acetyl/propionyl-CoA carboxylase alpha subunit
MGKFNKILIANRGEIALRIQQTAHAMEIQTVAVFARQDNASPHVSGADQAFLINLDGYKAYLEQDRIIEIAKKSGCDAIHPGYGFLSENAGFAQKVVDSGLCWIGPNPETIRLMGDKNQARLIAQKAGVPTVPGAETNFEQALCTAREVGFPLILKDPLGGGGKGTRRVSNLSEFEEALKTTRSEAQKLSGTSTILLERYLEKARHVEVQIAGDGVNYIHLFERDCSLQRRYQKIVEETPCKFVSKQTLEKMYRAAVNLAKSVGYKNIGTIEFMVTAQEEFYFLEMNTRLQVEHSVTEMTTGIDLVALQLEIAQTQKLKLKQNDVVRRGHAIQCRIYSENPKENFTPCTGRINYIETPKMPFIRIDSALEKGAEITPFFDPMQAKVTVLGQNRKMAISYILQALKNFRIQGVTTNIKFLEKLLRTKNFLTGRFDTQTVSSEFVKKLCLDNEDTLATGEIGAIAATILQLVQNKFTPSPRYRLDKKQKINAWQSQKWQ